MRIPTLLPAVYGHQLLTEPAVHPDTVTPDARLQMLQLGTGYQAVLLARSSGITVQEQPVVSQHTPETRRGETLVDSSLPTLLPICPPSHPFLPFIFSIPPPATFVLPGQSLDTSWWAVSMGRRAIGLSPSWSGAPPPRHPERLPPWFQVTRPRKVWCSSSGDLIKICRGKASQGVILSSAAFFHCGEALQGGSLLLITTGNTFLLSAGVLEPDSETWLKTLYCLLCACSDNNTGELWRL